MKNLHHIIMNILTFGFYDRFKRLESDVNRIILEHTSCDEEIDRLHTAIDRLDHTIIANLHNNLPSQVDRAVSEQIGDVVDRRVEAALDREYVRHNDLPDFDEFVRMETHEDGIFTVGDAKEVIYSEMERDWFREKMSDEIKRQFDLANRTAVWAMTQRLNSVLADLNQVSGALKGQATAPDKEANELRIRRAVEAIESALATISQGNA